MRCRTARELISLHVAPGESWLGAKERQALEAHLAVCEPCRRDYRESRQAIDLLREYWQISEDTKALLRKDRHGASGKTIKLHKTWRRAGAWAMAAACLMIGAFAWWTGAERPALVTRSEGPVASFGGDAPLVIEPAGEGDRIAPGAPIQTSAGQIKRLVLNGRHQLVVNAQSTLAVGPLTDLGGGGCLVSLSLGEVYVHVVHDSLPFAVQTAHGRAVITGTTFCVKATEVETILSVAEGSVRFESRTGAVQVTAGQQSKVGLASQSPSLPAPCDVAGLTAWAAPSPDMTGGAWAVTAASDLELDGLPLVPVTEVRTDASRIDYALWVEQKRGWFRQQFPWVFALREALAAEGIETDYPELLMRSREIWRFAYPPAGLGQQTEPEFDGLVAAAAHYGRGESWLKQHVPLVARFTRPSRQAAVSKVFERWAESVDDYANTDAMEPDSGVLLDSINALRFLVNTRTLAILQVRHAAGSPISQDKGGVAALLQEEIRVLGRCVESVNEVNLDGSDASSCECSDMLNSLAREIKKAGELEAKIRKHDEVVGQ